MTQQNDHFTSTIIELFEQLLRVYITKRSGRDFFLKSEIEREAWMYNILELELEFCYNGW